MRGWIRKGPDGLPKMEITDRIVINKEGKYDREEGFYGRCNICNKTFTNLSDFIEHFFKHDREGRIWKMKR